MTLLDGIFIGGVIVATGCFNVAINQLSKLCSKPYYLINRTDLLSFLFTPNIANNLIRKYKYFMSFSIRDLCTNQRPTLDTNLKLN